MQTIIVIFTERKLSLNEMVPYKRYKFLCNYDEDELKFNLKYINSKVCNTCFCASVPAMVLVYISTILYSMQVLCISGIKKMQSKQSRFLARE